LGTLHAEEALRQILEFRIGKTPPDESAFSRVYAILAKTKIPLRTHAALVDCFLKDRGLAPSAIDGFAIKTR